MPSSTQRSLAAGVVAALVAGVLAGLLEAVLFGLTHWRFTYVGAGVGALVGFAAGRYGRPADRSVLVVVSGVVTGLAVLVGDLVGWAAASSRQLAENGVEVSTGTLLRRLLLGGDLDLFGLRIDVRAFYREDLSFVLPVCLAFGVFVSAAVCRQQLDAATASAPVFAAPAGPPTPYPAYSYAVPSASPAFAPPSYGTPVYPGPDST